VVVLVMVIVVAVVVVGETHCWPSKHLYTTVPAEITKPSLMTTEARSQASENRNLDVVCRR